MEMLKGLLSLRGRQKRHQVSGGETDQETVVFPTRLDGANGVTISAKPDEFYVTRLNGVFRLDPEGSEGSTVNHPEVRSWAIDLANNAKEGR